MFFQAFLVEVRGKTVTHGNTPGNTMETRRVLPYFTMCYRRVTIVLLGVLPCVTVLPRTSTRKA